MTGLVRRAIHRPALTIGLCLLLAAVGLGYTARTLRFQTSSVELLPPDRVYVQQFKDYLRDFGELNDIVIVIEASQIAQAETFAARLADELRRPPLSAPRVTYRVDPEAFGGRALLYMSTEQLADLRDKVAGHRAFLEAYAAKPTLAQLVAGVDHEIARRFAGRFIDLGSTTSPRVWIRASSTRCSPRSTNAWPVRRRVPRRGVSCSMPSARSAPVTS